MIRWLLQAACLCLAPVTALAAERPNIVIIFADNLGMNDVGCFGSQIPTPNIDAIAQSGMKFTNCYVALSICTPSRFGLLTGRYPNRSQDRLLTALMVLEPRDDDRGIRPGETTIAAALRKLGYRTGIVGKWHLGHGDPRFLPTRHGFDSFFGYTGGTMDYFTGKYHDKPIFYRDEKLIDLNGYVPDLLTAEAVRFLEDQAPDKPFFLYFPCNVGHYGRSLDPVTKERISLLQPLEKYLKKVGHLPAGKRRDYAATVVAMDEGVGQVLDTLKRRKLEQNTLVVWLSDNGAMLDYGGSSDPFRGGIGTPFEGGVRVPCVMRWPGKIKAGTVSQQLASSLDLFPTVLAQVGLDAAPYRLDGINLSPVLFEGKEVPRDLFWQMADGSKAFRRGSWKYVLTNKGEELLFDLVADPGERTNLAAAKGDVLSELKAGHQKVAGTLGAK